ncbi:unnamed protein product [Anisakis simplex]|uniref:Uncharacterized protein n=1 Tax=Anisakis simplex TaxID=6269 RepID=A0A3P6SM20_ANISI|nr:unnamed protein product [Anisakis simplex]
MLGMGDEELLVNSLYGVLVTTYLKMDPPQIGEALCDISERSAKRNFLTYEEDGKGFERKWIEYIAMIMPRANLMRAALSFYNIPLAVISAQYSQQRICKEVGMHLFRKRLYEEAILMFHKSDDLKMIIECIETGFLWRDVPDLELNNRITSKECEKILTKLHNHAENIANYSALADISLMTAQSASGIFSNPSEEMKETYEKMTQMYCMASDWKRALLCAHHQPGGNSFM